MKTHHSQKIINKKVFSKRAFHPLTPMPCDVPSRPPTLLYFLHSVYHSPSDRQKYIWIHIYVYSTICICLLTTLSLAKAIESIRIEVSSAIVLAFRTLSCTQYAINKYLLNKWTNICCFPTLHSPCGSDSTESACQCRRPGFDHWVGKIPWTRAWQPTPIFLPGESHGQRSLVGYGPGSHKESDTTERLTHILCAKALEGLWYELPQPLLSETSFSKRKTSAKLQDYATKQENGLNSIFWKHKGKRESGFWDDPSPQECDGQRGGLRSPRWRRVAFGVLAMEGLFRLSLGRCSRRWSENGGLEAWSRKASKGFWILS